MLCWKGPVRIISSSSWPCTRHPKNHSRCCPSPSCVLVSEVRNSSHCLEIIQSALLLGCKWLSPSGRCSNRTKAKTSCHIILTPCNNPSGILTMKHFTRLFQCFFTFVFRVIFLCNSSVGPLLKYLCLLSETGKLLW